MNQIKSADSLLTPRQHYTNKPHHNASLLHFATIDRPTNNNNTSSNPRPIHYFVKINNKNPDVHRSIFHIAMRKLTK